VTLPDFSAIPLPEVLLASLRQQGCFLLREILPLSLLQAAKAELEALYLEADQAWQKGEMPQAAYHKLFQYGHLPFEEGLLPLSQNPAMEVDLYTCLLGIPSLRPFLSAIFGPSVFLIDKNSQPRRQHPFWPERQIPFHQDAEFLGGRPALNFWIPLDPCGRNAPGLELWLKPQQRVWFELNLDPLTPLYQQRDVSALQAQASRDQFWQPEMEPGDLLVFDSFLFHRTWLTESMFEPRYSLEIRLTHPAYGPGLKGREWGLRSAAEASGAGQNSSPLD